MTRVVVWSHHNKCMVGNQLRLPPFIAQLSHTSVYLYLLALKKGFFSPPPRANILAHSQGGRTLENSGTDSLLRILAVVRSRTSTTKVLLLGRVKPYFNMSGGSSFLQKLTVEVNLEI